MAAKPRVSLRAGHLRSEFADVAILANYGVAFAGGSFEFAAIEDFYRAAVVLDDLIALQNTRGKAHAGPVSAQHGGQKIMGNRQHAGIDAILGHQQPASKKLL